MINGYKITILILSGRRLYMLYGLVHLLEDSNIDNILLYINTNNLEDIKFIKLISNKFSNKITIYEDNDNPENKKLNFISLYKLCSDNNTIYIKVDDDVIWYSPNFIENLVQYRIKNPLYLVISPLVINNAVCTDILLQNSTKYLKYFSSRNDYYNMYLTNISSNHYLFWGDPWFACVLLTWFLNDHIIKNDIDIIDKNTPDIIPQLHRFSINCISWIGSSLYSALHHYFNTLDTSIYINSGDYTLHDDENIISRILPVKFGYINAFITHVLCVHFTFRVQEDGLLNFNLLNLYKEYYDKIWKDNDIYNFLISISN